MSFKMTIWNRSYEKIGTIERPTATELLDMGSRLQRDYGAVYKVEYVSEAHDEARRAEGGEEGLDLTQRT